MNGLRGVIGRAASVFASVLLAAVLSGCSATGVLSALEPKHGVSITRGVAYGDGDRQVLDVYRPKASKPATPMVVFVYGGGWEGGERKRYGFVGKAFARSGHLTVIPDYRLYPDVRWPDFLRDCAAAVRWAKENAARLGADPRRIVLVGHSAGAYNVVSLALDRRWLAEQGLDPRQDLAGVAGLAGPYDFLPLHSETLNSVFGPEGQRPDTQPINHVDGQAPPIWLGAGKRDTVVLPENSSRLSQRITDAGGAVELHIYEHSGHAMLIGALAAPLRSFAPVYRDVTAFIDATAPSAK